MNIVNNQSQNYSTIKKKRSVSKQNEFRSSVGTNNEEFDKIFFDLKKQQSSIYQVDEVETPKKNKEDFMLYGENMMELSFGTPDKNLKNKNIDTPVKRISFGEKNNEDIEFVKFFNFIYINF